MRPQGDSKGARMKECSVQGCTKPAGNQFGAMCEQHRQRQRRHGDARQESIRATEIKPCVERVEKIVERDKSGKISAGLDKLVEILTDYCEGIVSDFEHGRPMNQHKVQAAREILTVFREFSPLQCAGVVAGMHLYMHENPHRFSTDRGFTFELVRQFRSISDANVGFYDKSGSGKVKRAYKEIPPRTIGQLGYILVDGYKTFVALVRRHEIRQAERMQEARNLLQEGFDNLPEDAC